MKNICIAYSNRLFAEGLELIFKLFDEYQVVQSSPVDIDHTGYSNNLDIVIFEFDYPKKEDVKKILSILNTHPGILILVISNLSSNNISSELLESGISGYLLKACSKEDLLNALNKMSEGKNYFCTDITRELICAEKKIQNNNETLLTEREKEILIQLVTKNSTNEVAEILNISENTVKTHRRNIRTKLGAQNSIGMFLYAIRNKLLEFSDHDLCLECPYFSNN